MGWRASFPGRLIDAGEAQSRAGRALLEERYRALQRQIPILYLVALTNFLGLELATGGRIGSLYSVSTLLIALVCLRLVHWVRARGRRLAPERILVELTKTWIYALIISVGFCAWALHLLNAGPRAYDDYVIFFGSFAAVGCAYGITAYPAAA